VTTRILLDQNVPAGLRRALRAYEVTTAARMGWGKIENGELIETAENAGFTILVTCDRNIRYQQNLTVRQIAVIELATNRWADIQPWIGQLTAAIEEATSGSYATVTFPRPPLRRRPPPRLEC
jgi:hypothetical protein